jgi:hypothetical protein
MTGKQTFLDNNNLLFCRPALPADQLTDLVISREPQTQRFRHSRNPH